MKKNYKKLILLTLFLFYLCDISLEASTLHLSLSANPARLNPLLATDSASGEITSFLFNGLVKWDKYQKKIIPDLAKSYYFKDNKTLIFKLRKNVKWHDGYPFNADDVLFTYQTLISPKIASPYSSSFRFVQSVKKIDKYSVEVRYKKPYFKALETWMMGIIPKHLLKDEKNILNSSFNTHPVGTGAYKLKRLEFSKDIILEANDDYFEHRPHIDQISFHVIPDSMTRFLMLKSKQLDIGSLSPIEYEKKLPKEFGKDFNIYESIALAYTYLGFNLKRKKFQDPRVREALSQAIDRQEIIDIMFFGHAKLCTGPFLPTSSAFNPDVKAPKRDLKRAKELLKEAGYDKKHPLVFEIATSNSNPTRPYVAQIIQHQLKSIGVVVKLRIMEWQAFLNMVVFPRKFDTVLLGWGLSPTPDPRLFWHSGSDVKGGFNFVGYHNKEVDRLIEESETVVDREKLSRIWQKIFAIVVHDNPYLFLYIPTSISAVSKKIHGIEALPSGYWHNYIDWIKE
ncbi:Dipeptide-binding ABC transporter, periplasmic substrate-binding component (TC 3.A.1.5.2) [hydrothermal vent metagenome]|uniref:Dipeptide-binding ABC transporter, periplasmic substrate-binding component (TC 3.A.1.5.2) n=1 Tax=hydrothermal vent metagenome TaxID=652676 RepID=A0A1W1C2Z8_9ZZZZ